MKELFATVQKRCPPEAWSRGVALARSHAVTVESDEEDEVVARVRVMGGAVAPTVWLYPEELEWECDCQGPLDACEHVAAVIIAKRLGTIGSSESRPVLYRLSRRRGGLFLERGVEEEGSFVPIEHPLEAIASGTFHGPLFDAKPADLEVDRALRGRFSGLLERGAIERVFGALAGSKHVSFDGTPVDVSGAPIVSPVLVEDAGEGFRLRIGEATGEPFVLHNGCLHPTKDPALSGREREELTRGRFFGPDEVATLAGEVLPSLKKRTAVEVRTLRLPKAAKSPPRLTFLLQRNGDRLYVLPRIQYAEPVPLRDFDAERRLQDELARRYGLALDCGQELSTEAAIDFVSDLEGVEVEGDGLEAFRLHGTLTPSVHVGDRSLGVDFEVPGRSADPKAVLRAWQEGLSRVALTTGGFARLPEDWLDRCGDHLADLLAARAEDGTLPAASMPDLTRLCAALEMPPPRQVEMETVGAIPRELETRLRDYQRRGVEWLLVLRAGGLGALLADDMGLGKTVQALGALRGRSLVVAPTSVLANWISEASRFRPDLSLRLYHGADRRLDEAADLTITSHALLRLDRDRLEAVSWDVVVLDESQAIRNPETDLARAAFSLRARFRVGLTGTPIENRPLDLWSQSHFLNPGFLGSREDFERRYLRPLERGEAEPLRRLRERMRPFVLRRLKAEVAPELPPRTEVTLRAQLSDRERAIYDAIRLAVRRDVVARLGKPGGVLTALVALLRLRQAACHPALVPGQTAESSSKTELLIDALGTATDEGHKSLVFSQWTRMLDLLETPLRARGIGFVRLDGSTRGRAGVVERFENDEDASVFLVSLKAGGTGLNLTAADHVFLFDPWWNPAVEEQAFDRAHRIGQDKPVFVHRLVAENTVEEKILTLQQDKQALAAMATGGTSSPITRDELLQLLE